MTCLRKSAGLLLRLLVFLALFVLLCYPCGAETKIVITESQLNAIQENVQTMMQSVNELQNCVQEQEKLLKERNALIASLREYSKSLEQAASTWKMVSKIEAIIIAGCAAGVLTYCVLN